MAKSNRKAWDDTEADDTRNYRGKWNKSRRGGKRDMAEETETDKAE